MLERPLIEQPCVLDEIEKAHAAYSRFHDLYDGITWRLCRDPVPDEAIEVAPETYVLRSAKYQFAGFCVIILVYTYTNGTLIVEDLKVEAI